MRRTTVAVGPAATGSSGGTATGVAVGVLVVAPAVGVLVVLPDGVSPVPLSATLAAQAGKWALGWIQLDGAAVPCGASGFR